MPKFNKLLIATGNKGKLSEISNLLKQANIEAIGSFEYNLKEPEENGQDFAQNSLIKARYYGEEIGLVSLADDSGLCVDLLDGQPGIHSARWAFNEETQKRDFEFAFEKIKNELIKKNINYNSEIIKAHFVCNLTIYNPKTKESESFEGRVDGTLTFNSKGKNGFGYDPIFIPNGYNQTFGELNPKIKDKISHRNDAFIKLVEWLD